MNCTCEDWINSWPQIKSAQLLAFTHGQNYTGAIFKFCPFCGNQFNRTPVIEAIEKERKRKPV